MSETAIVFVHGFMGSPRQFSALSEAAAAQGGTPVLLTLPGHETNMSGFASAGTAAWQAEVDNCLTLLRPQFDRILLVGHSMGCLLAIRAAVANPEKILGILALAPPLKNRLSLTGIRRRIRCLRPARPGEDCHITAARALCGVTDLTLRSAARLLPNTLRLLLLIRETRHLLPQLTVPLHAVTSTGDDIVSPRTGTLLLHILPGAVHTALRESSHFWYAPAEQAQISAILSHFL